MDNKFALSKVDDKYEQGTYCPRDDDPPWMAH